MLKKSGTLVLTMLYLVTVLGFALNLHYCFNTLTSVKIDVPAKPGNNAMAKMKCCSDKRVDVKIKDAHQSQAQSVLAKIFSFQFPRLHFSDILLPLQKTLLQKFFERGPPGISSGLNILIRHCIFRI